MGRSVLSELKIPADPEFISVAKAVGNRLGSRMGFSLDHLDELSIAVAEACGSAIQASRRAWGAGASLKVTFADTPRGLAVEVIALGPRSPQALPPPQRPPARERLRQEDLERLTNEMIRMFVDDFRTQVDGQRVRYRMVKYKIG